MSHSDDSGQQSPTQPRHGPGAADSRRLRLRNAGFVLVVVVGWVYLLLGPDAKSRNAVSSRLSHYEVRSDARVGRFVEIDMAALQAAFQQVGLPDPPDLNGADPIPVDILLTFAQKWVRTHRVEFLGQLGQVYQGLEEHRTALACFAAAAHLDSSDVRWLYGLGAECQAMGLTDPAIDALDRARRMDPDYPTTYARLGALYLDRDDLKRAEANYKEYQQRRPNESLGYVGLGRVALARGDHVRAVELLKTAARLTTNDFMAYRFLSRALAAGGKYEEAQAAADTAEQLPHYKGWLVFDERLAASHALANTQRYLANQMRLAAGAGDFQRFVDIARKLLERRPGDFQTLSNLAGVYSRLGRLDEAEAAIDRAIELNPDGAALFCVRAEVAFLRRDFPAVHEALDAAAGLDARLARIHDLRGRALFVQGRPADAIASLQWAITLDPLASESRLVLAEMYRQMGDPAEAVRVLSQLLELDPGNARARQLLEAIRAAHPDPSG